MAMQGSRPFARVLVANRGEIAVRVMRTLRRLGIVSVGVVTPADGGAPHAREADLTLEVPSYLDAEAIVAAATRAGADALHPGYGFLSESPVLARACADAGIVWVGPDRRALELMGDKIAAKAHVAGIGVPVIPGIAEEPGERDDHTLVARASAEVGYPLIVKPSAGGGGKGMQVVRAADDLPAALAAARRLAAASFGDDTLLLERLVTRPRHIEAQVLGDVHGRVELLGLRECSLQRRHQKVIEEAPAPYPGAPTRDRLGEAAVRIARSVGYAGVGTVEMLVSGDDPTQWFFLEMNTRLQVEHPVTEAVTGVDLVEEQLRVAAGERLPARELVERGHAIEARVYAERPERGFLPSTGRLLELLLPDGVRVDSGVDAGQLVSADYDPMLFKVIAQGADRAEALARLEAALARTVVLGVHTNLAYLRSLLAQPQVVDGVADTALLDVLGEPVEPAPDTAVLAAAAHAFAPPEGPGDSPWTTRSGWRIGEHRAPSSVLLVAGEAVEVAASATLPPGVRTAVDGDTAWVWRGGRVWEIARLTRDERVARSRRVRAGAVAEPQVRTPMPGTVVALGVEDGASVGAGDTIVVVEAMKMENPVTAPADGTVELRVRLGDVVAADQVVAVVHPG